MSLFSLSLTDSRSRSSVTQHRAYGGAAITGRPTRAGGDAPARQTAPEPSTQPRETIPALRIAASSPKRALLRPWWLGLDGARHNPDHGTVETKTKRASCSGAHREHDSRLGEGGDVLEQLGHGEVDGGGASVSFEEEDIAQWRWTTRGEASRPRRSDRARQSC